MTQNKPIPRYIDNIPQVFFWEFDEFIVFLACLSLGIVVGGLYSLLGVALGIYAASALKTYKDDGLPGQLSHLAHWNNLININSEFPKSGERRLFK